MLGCRFSFETHEKQEREKATKCSLKTAEVLLYADRHGLTHAWYLLRCSSPKEAHKCPDFFQKKVDVRSEIQVVYWTINPGSFRPTGKNYIQICTGFNNILIYLIKSCCWIHCITFGTYLEQTFLKKLKNLEYIPYKKWPNLNPLGTTDPYQFFPNFRNSIRKLFYNKWQPL